MLETMPNLSRVFTFESHKIDLPSMCPVSGNPQPSSWLRISYVPQGKHLEVYSLKNYIDTFVGGLKCPCTGAIVVRDMESTVQLIAQECANTLIVKVRVLAKLKLDAGGVTLKCIAFPQ